MPSQLMPALVSRSFLTGTRYSGACASASCAATQMSVGFLPARDCLQPDPSEQYSQAIHWGDTRSMLPNGVLGSGQLRLNWYKNP